ncbi:unnamed protein product, partial [Prorocentrum cordatum]
MVSRRPTSGNSLCTAGSRRGPEGAPRAQRRVGLAARPRGPRPPSGPGRPPGAPSGPRAMPPRPASAREPTRRVCERPVADLEVRLHVGSQTSGVSKKSNVGCLGFEPRRRASRSKDRGGGF